VSLESLLAGGRTLSQTAAARILREQVGAIAAAHAHVPPVIHRDIKPANILLDASGASWLTDFGIAKTDDAPGVSMTGFVPLTRSYASPEQLRGQAPVTFKTDYYSLGLVAYRMLTGGLPRRIPAERASGVEPGLSRRWDRLFKGLLDENPDTRLADPRGILAQLAVIERDLSGGRVRRGLARAAAVACALALVFALARDPLRLETIRPGLGSRDDAPPPPASLPGAEPTAFAEDPETADPPAPEPPPSAPESPASAAATPKAPAVASVEPRPEAPPWQGALKLLPEAYAALPVVPLADAAAHRDKPCLVYAGDAEVAMPYPGMAPNQVLWSDGGLLRFRIAKEESAAILDHWIREQQRRQEADRSRPPGVSVGDGPMPLRYTNLVVTATLLVGPRAVSLIGGGARVRPVFRERVEGVPDASGGKPLLRFAVHAPYTNDVAPEMNVGAEDAPGIVFEKGVSDGVEQEFKNLTWRYADPYQSRPPWYDR
jgi:hypothetical protein